MGFFGAATLKGVGKKWPNRVALRRAKRWSDSDEPTENFCMQPKHTQHLLLSLDTSM